MLEKYVHLFDRIVNVCTYTLVANDGKTKAHYNSDDSCSLLLLSSGIRELFIGDRARKNGQGGKDHYDYAGLRCQRIRDATILLIADPAIESSIRTDSYRPSKYSTFLFFYLLSTTVDAAACFCQ